MATVIIDGKAYETESGDNLLSVCLSLGLDLPYFCWHPALGSVGACRQCAVTQYQDEHDTKGRLVMACMTPAADGTRITIDDEASKSFRASVVQWMMTNHPHDCAVCDEGGECHLQDMTVMTGHEYRRYRFPKRTFRNQDLGPFIHHEMNRCITCYRCVRFYRDYAGGRDLDAFASKNHVYFGRHGDGPLESPFSGNLVEVCPTGVFTDKTLRRHYTRKWDLETSPTVCHQCGVGCNLIVGARDGRLRRVLNRYNHDVNGYFICDRGRFGYQSIETLEPLLQPLFRQPQREKLDPTASHSAMQRLQRILQESRQIIGIGSPWTSLESNFALQQLVGEGYFSTGLAKHDQAAVERVLQVLREGPVATPSLRELEQADAVLILGEELWHSAPRMALAVRQSVLAKRNAIARAQEVPLWQAQSVLDAGGDARHPLFVFNAQASPLDDIAEITHRSAPLDAARLGFAIAAALDPKAAAVTDLDADAQRQARAIAERLRQARRPAVITGTAAHASPLIEAAANVAWALRQGGAQARLACVTPQANALGSAVLGGADLHSALASLRAGEADTVIVAGNDLYRHAPRELVERALDAARHVVVIDQTLNDTARRAHVVLPAAGVFESDGTLINYEGRAQRCFKTMPAKGDAQPPWQWLAEIGRLAGHAMGQWRTFDHVRQACARSVAGLAGIVEASPDAGFRVLGRKAARQSPRYSGRTALAAHSNVHEQAPLSDDDSPLAFTMEGERRQLPAALIPAYWAPRWNSVQALNKFQMETGGPARGGPSGIRLFQPAVVEADYFRQVPPARQPAPGEWLVVPMHAWSGTAPQPSDSEIYLAINRDEAQPLGAEGDVVEVELEDTTLRLPLRLTDNLPRGIAGLFAGGIDSDRLPAHARVNRVRP